MAISSYGSYCGILLLKWYWGKEIYELPEWTFWRKAPINSPRSSHLLQLNFDNITGLTGIPLDHHALHAMDGMAYDNGPVDHSQMDHGQMDHSQMDHGEMDHSKMDHSQMNPGEMDHSSMGGMMMVSLRTQ